MEIFDIYKREKDSKKLVEVDESFYKRIADRIRKYQKLLDTTKDDLEEAHKLRTELLNMRDMIRDIFFYRLEKILKLLLLETRENMKILNKENLTYEESQLVEILSSILQSYKQKILNKVFSGEYPNFQDVMLDIKQVVERKATMIDKILVVFVENCSQIVAPDMKVYGPFSKGDICTLPEDVAENLINLNVCKKIEIR